MAAQRGLSLSSLVAQQLTELAEADERYERARAVALDALANAADRRARLASAGSLRPMKTFVDTNVLVYAHDRGAGARHETARALLAELWGTGGGSLSTQVLQEFYTVATRKLRPPIPLEQARAIVAAYGEWCDVATEPQLIVAASRLEEEHSLSFWDSLIAAAAIRAGAGRLVSEDLQGGRRFGTLTIENHFTND